MLNRREFLGTAAAAQAMMPKETLKAAELLAKGQRFNEMQEFNDSITGHPSRRMTAGRRFNQTPTYTQNACFTADSRQMVLSTEDAVGNSAILKADVETGEMLVVATTAEVKGTPLKANINGNNYHGPSSTGGQFFGAADLDGKVVWEYSIPSYQYGHLSTHPTWNALITDGMFTDDLVCAVFFKELDPTGAPQLQVLARHNTDWSSEYGQYSHPHCHVSPDGRWLTYNRGGARLIKGDKPVAPGKGRTDVYLTRIG